MGWSPKMCDMRIVAGGSGDAAARVGTAREGRQSRACYEASGAGYVLQRAMQGWGYHCDVIAPSLIPVKPGVPPNSQFLPPCDRCTHTREEEEPSNHAVFADSGANSVSLRR